MVIEARGCGSGYLNRFCLRATFGHLRRLPAFFRDDRIRESAVFDDMRGAPFRFDAIDTSPSRQGPVSLEDSDVAVPVQRLSNDMDTFSRIVSRFDQLAAQGTNGALSGPSVLPVAAVFLKAALDVTGGIGADEFDGDRSSVGGSGGVRGCVSGSVVIVHVLVPLQNREWFDGRKIAPVERGR